MAIFIEAPYISALKEEYLTKCCSSCFKFTSNKCPNCKIMVYCNNQCRINDEIYHKIECQSYKNQGEKITFEEKVLARMMARVLTRLNIDGGQPNIDLCSNLPKSIRRRSWFDLLGHRNEIPNSDRHWKLWLKTIDQFKLLFHDQFDHIDLLEIFGKILINRFRVAFHENPFNERVSIGWAIYLTTSCFNHSCQPDLLQCSYDINMHLKFNDSNKNIPETTIEFYKLTVSYRHQNDFRLKNPLSYVPTRKQRRDFVSFFFFNCHCVHCADDLRNRYDESMTNRLCNQCGDFLVLEKDFQSSTNSILICLGRTQCSQYNKIFDHINILFIDHTEENIEIYENKLSKIEELLHPNSILLLQQREKVFFAYQKLLNENNFNENQRQNFVNRAIQLGELLIKQYDIYLKQSSLYPKIFLTDLAKLYELVGNTQQAKNIYEKALDLWQNDYQNHINYKDFYLKLFKN